MLNWKVVIRARGHQSAGGDYPNYDVTGQLHTCPCRESPSYSYTCNGQAQLVLEWLFSKNIRYVLAFEGKRLAASCWLLRKIHPVSHHGVEI